MPPHRTRPTPTSNSAFARYYFPDDVIVLPVRWCLRFNLSYRDLEELLAERGIEVDHTSVYRWVQRFTPLLADAERWAATITPAEVLSQIGSPFAPDHPPIVSEDLDHAS